MPAASITLEDDNGGVACKLVFSGGFDKASHAHQHAQILIGLMDQYMVRNGAAVVDPVVTEGEGKALAVPESEPKTPSADAALAALAAIRKAAELQRG